MFFSVDAQHLEDIDFTILAFRFIRIILLNVDLKVLLNLLGFTDHFLNSMYNYYSIILETFLTFTQTCDCIILCVTIACYFLNIHCDV